MKLQQLRFVAAVAQHGLNITVAARQLDATQPAVSKQLRLLEEELGFHIFVRAGRTLTKITSPGERLVAYALRALREVQNIKEMSEEFKDENRGSLSIGTTHTQARYVLPRVIQQFRGKYPNVQLHLHQGTAEQIAEMVKLGRIDLAMATGSKELFRACALLPCYEWYHHVVVPLHHPLAKVHRLSLKQLARFPILTYDFSLAGPLSLLDMFSRAGFRADIALTAPHFRRRLIDQAAASKSQEEVDALFANVQLPGHKGGSVNASTIEELGVSSS